MSGTLIDLFETRESYTGTDAFSMAQIRESTGRCEKSIHRDIVQKLAAGEIEQLWRKEGRSWVKVYRRLSA